MTVRASVSGVDTNWTLFIAADGTLGDRAMGTEGANRAVARLRDENERLRAAVEDAQQQLHQSKREKAMLQAR